MCCFHFLLRKKESVKQLQDISNSDPIAYRHGVDLPFDLLIPCQGSFQAFLGVELGVPALVDVSTNTRHTVSLGKHDYESIIRINYIW